MKIKFRAWDTEKKEMATVLRMSFDEDDITLMDSECGIWNTVKGYVAIPMQYTGLKDSNNKEIYEGDIIDIIDSNGSHICEVKFIDGCFVSIEVGDSDEVCLREDISNFPHTIIGNIYQNPELLQQIK